MDFCFALFSLLSQVHQLLVLSSTMYSPTCPTIALTGLSVLKTSHEIVFFFYVSNDTKYFKQLCLVLCIEFVPMTHYHNMPQL